MFDWCAETEDYLKWLPQLFVWQYLTNLGYFLKKIAEFNHH